MAAALFDDCAAADHFFAAQHEMQVAVATATMEKPSLCIATIARNCVAPHHRPGRGIVRSRAHPN